MTADDLLRGFALLRERYPSATVLLLPVRRAGAIAVAQADAALYNHVNAEPLLGRGAETLNLAGVRWRAHEVPALVFVYRPEGWNTERAPDGTYYRVATPGGAGPYPTADFGPLEALAVEPPSEVPA